MHQLLQVPGDSSGPGSVSLISSGVSDELFNPRGSLVVSHQLRTIINLPCLLQRVGVRTQSEHGWEELPGRIIASRRKNVREDMMMLIPQLRKPLAVCALSLASDPHGICKLVGVRVEGS